MEGIYTLLGGILLYFTVLRLLNASRLGIIAASLIVTLGYFALTTATQWIILTGYDAPLSQLFAAEKLITVAMQAAIAVFVFYKIDNDEDSYTAWLGWGVAGCIAIFFIAPYIATNIVRGLL